MPNTTLKPPFIRSNRMSLPKFIAFACALAALPVFCFMLTPSFASAATGNDGKSYTLLEPLPCIPSTVTNSDGSKTTIPCPPAENGNVSMIKEVSLGNFFQYAFNILIALAAVSAVFMMVYGGFLYITTSSSQTKSDGLGKFTNAIYGLLMVLAAYLVLKTVNPELVQIPTSIPAIVVPKNQLESPMEYFDRLTAEANKYQQQGQQFVKLAQEAKERVASLEDENSYLKIELEDLYNLGLDDDPMVRDIKTRIEANNRAIVEDKAKVEVELAKSILANGIISKNLQDINNLKSKGLLKLADIEREFSVSNREIGRTRDTRSASLVKMGALTYIDEINAWANYAELALQLSRVETIVSNIRIDKSGLGTKTAWLGDEMVGRAEDVRSKLVTDLTSVINKVPLNVSDQQLRQNLLDKLSETNALIINIDW